VLLSDGNCNYLGGALVNLTSPNLSFSDFTNLAVPNNQYFQYRVLLESDDQSGTPTFPSLSSIDLGDTRYYGGSPEIVTTSGQSFSEWTGLSATTNGSCTITYQASLDKSTWYYHNGTTWTVAASSSDSNTVTAMDTNAASFATTIGSGTLFFKLFLNSDTSQDCSISDITATGKQ
ncbi:MAG: hypothetical protein KC478_17145, partial [Bacteriovoracaceae bacterium]|nr:hypothetical protein [Bacteriovoracaceae bacterium]